MFPFDADENEELELEESEEVEEEVVEPPTEYGVDFKTGKMTGAKVTGSKAVAVWAWNALMFPRYRYEIVDFQYGSELSDMIGKVMTEDQAAMMAESIIRDTFSINPFIEDIANLECSIDEDRLTISFYLVTSFGEEEITNVTIR